VAQELKQRIGVQVFNDPQGTEEERPGRIRVYEPQGEDFFSQVRICTVNGCARPIFIPHINIGDYLPAEIQQDCGPKIVGWPATGSMPRCAPRTALEIFLKVSAPVCRTSPREMASF